MPITNTQVYTGNIVEVSFDGIVVGMLQSLRASEDPGLDAVSGVGSALAQEYVPTMIRYSLSASLLQMRTQSLESVSGRQLASRTGKDALNGLVFDIIVRKKDGSMLKRWVQCSYGGGTIEITKHAIIGRDVTFMAIDSDGDFLGNSFAASS